MGNQTIRAKVVALGILLVLTLNVYMLWRSNQTVERAMTVEHVQTHSRG